ncbi:MAG: lysophospholipid acyltransferase family protein [Bacteroidales bacterium]|nr:lysophospholipid acyltransferase family protein [Bacteroidales bacterium]
MKFLGAVLFYVFVWVFALIPFFILYLISEFVYVLIYHIFSYRKKTILKNLKACFPEKNDKEIKKMLSPIYKNISDNILEGIKVFTMTRKQIEKRHKILNPEILEPYFKANKSIVAVTGHYGNWEWGSLSASLQTVHNLIAFYKPLSNKIIDSLVRKSRQRCGTTLASIKETSATFDRYKEIPTIFLMAADQSPGRKYIENAHWIDFFGRDTAFLHGPEKYAKANNYPVFYIDIQRVKRGYYEIELSILTENPKDLEDGEITKRFAKKLESVINKNPSDWLWSHNRWKLKR